jgi:hypothetical protein
VIPNRCSVIRATTAKPSAARLSNAVVKPQCPAPLPGKYGMLSTKLSMPCAIAFFNRAKNSRRVATRYDKLIESFAAFLPVSASGFKFVHAA